jgi:hypothetical protein
MNPRFLFTVFVTAQRSRGKRRRDADISSAAVLGTPVVGPLLAALPLAKAKRIYS